MADKWQYSINNGTTWINVSGLSFTIPTGNYPNQSIIARRVDDAGNQIGNQIKNLKTFIIDQTPPDAPSFELKYDTGSKNNDGITNSGLISLTSLLEPKSSWEYSINSGINWISVPTGAPLSFILPTGIYPTGSIRVREIDLAGNIGPASGNTGIILVDTSVPPLTAKLKYDTGLKDNDGFTQSGLIEVSGIESGAVWEYSKDSGVNWVVGSGLSFILPTGIYQSNSIVVRQTDLAGNVSIPSKNFGIINVDTTAPVAPTGFLFFDSGPINNDNITNTGIIKVSGIESGALWEYKINNQTVWITGSGSTFIVPTGTYDIGSILIRQTDKAGNISIPSGNSGLIIIDTQVSKPKFSLAFDNGLNNKDNITNTGLILVSGLEIGSSWEYSINSGRSWVSIPKDSGWIDMPNNSSGLGFILPDGVYTSGKIYVRQTDLAGNRSFPEINSTNITIDTTIGTPILSLASRSMPSLTASAPGATSTLFTVNMVNNTSIPQTWGVNNIIVTGKLTDFIDDTPIVFGFGSGVVEQSQSSATIKTARTGPNVTATANGSNGGDGAVLSVSLSQSPINPEDEALWHVDTIEVSSGGSGYINGDYIIFSLSENDIEISPAYAILNTTRSEPTLDISGNGIGANFVISYNLNGISPNNTWSIGSVSVGSGGSGYTNDSLLNVNLGVDDISLESATLTLSTIVEEPVLAATTVYAYGGSGVIFGTPVLYSFTPPQWWATSSDTLWGISSIPIISAGINYLPGNYVEISVVDGYSVAAAWVRVTQVDESGGIVSAAPYPGWQGGYYKDTGIAQKVNIYGAGSYYKNTSNIQYITVISSGDYYKPTSNISRIIVNDPGKYYYNTGINNNVFDVSNIEPGARWEYSIDYGNSWIMGSGTSIQLFPGTYPDGSIRLRQTDIAGNTSIEISNTETIEV